MKKIYLTLLLLIPAFLANAAGPVRTWNDQLDDFITAFNELDPALEQLYSDNGISAFTFTYFDPETGNVVKEASIFDSEAFNKVNDQLMEEAKKIVVDNLSASVKKNARLSSIVNEFEKRNTKIVLLYSTTQNDKKLTKQIVITPSEIK